MPSTLDQSHCLQAASHLPRSLYAGTSAIGWLLQLRGQLQRSNTEEADRCVRPLKRGAQLQEQAEAQCRGTDLVAGKNCLHPARKSHVAVQRLPLLRPPRPVRHTRPTPPLEHARAQPSKNPATVVNGQSLRPLGHIARRDRILTYLLKAEKTEIYSVL